MLSFNRNLFPFQIGDTFHVDVFHTERKPCTSQFFLETTELVFVQNDTTEDPPMDYFLYVEEDFHVDGILAELMVKDVYSVGDYAVVIIRGKNLMP